MTREQSRLKKEEEYARRRINESPLNVNHENCSNCEKRLFADYVKIGDKKYCAHCALKVA